MQISTKIITLRGTVFIDRVLPFSINLVKIFQDVLKIPNTTPIILQDIQPVFVPGQLNQNWGLNENDRNIVEIYGNKIDFFSFGESKNEAAFCECFAEQMNSLVTELNVKTRRLAFAPTYTIENEDIIKFYERNLCAPNFKDANMQEFSMNRVYYKSEDFNGISFNMIYNVNIVLQQGDMLGIDKTKNLIIMNDINTRDFGNRFYSKDEVDVFYANVPKRNQELLKFFLGE